MNYYYITGTSRGIGKAMAEFLLKEKENFVVGISRKSTIENKNYHHISLDLTNLYEVRKFKFENHTNAKRICLINNSGAIGQVKPVGKLSNEQIINDYNLNLVAPTVLCNNFISAYKDVNAEKIIVNVSSGAGKNPVDGWGVYCASKAGIDLFSRVIDNEQKLTAKNGFRIFSVAPGVVDTQMQTDIRSASKEDFSRLNDFLNYKNTGQLAEANTVAEKFFKILNQQGFISEVLLSVKDF